MNNQQTKEPCPGCGKLLSRTAVECEECGLTLVLQDPIEAGQAIEICQVCGSEYMNGKALCDCGKAIQKDNISKNVAARVAHLKKWAGIVALLTFLALLMNVMSVILVKKNDSFRFTESEAVVYSRLAFQIVTMLIGLVIWIMIRVPKPGWYYFFGGYLFVGGIGSAISGYVFGIAWAAVGIWLFIQGRRYRSALNRP